MSVQTANVLMIGDIVGAPGLRALFTFLPSLIRKTNADLVIANGENALKGFGISAEEVAAMRSYGVDIITSGNPYLGAQGCVRFARKMNVLTATSKLSEKPSWPRSRTGRSANEWGAGPGNRRQ